MAIGDPFPKKRLKAKSAKRSARPPLRRAKRGKPFEKGNSHGLATRFVKGICPNPGGRPKSTKYSDALRALVSADLGEKVKPRTGAEKVALQVFRMSERGNISAIRELGDRCEGRPAQSISFDENRSDPLLDIIAGMREMSSRIGPPEGSRPPMLEAGDEDSNQ